MMKRQTPNRQTRRMLRRRSADSWAIAIAGDAVAIVVFAVIGRANRFLAGRADVIATGFSVTLVAVSEFGRNVRENGSAGNDHGRATTMFAMGKGIAGGRVLTKNWVGLARENLEAGQDLKVTLDFRDVLAEIVQNRLANPNLSLVFPTWTPTMLGVTR